jgi:hypothetical protein
VQPTAAAEAAAAGILFASANPVSGLLSAKVAAGLLSKSGLSKSDLRKAWTTAKTTGPKVAGPGHMDLAEFLIACQLCVSGGGISPAATAHNSAA